MSEQYFPISERHRTFARRLVALARDNGCDSLTVTFRLGSGQFTGSDQDWTSVQLTWVDGRHGAPGQINLRAEAHDSFPEIDE